MAEGDRENDRGPSESEIKITDRRMFTADGELRDELGAGTEQAEPVAEPTPEPSMAEATKPDATGEPEGHHEEGFQHRPVEDPEGVDFTMLLNAMAHPALLFLGEIPHPASGETQVDLEQARIQIDFLSLLQVKCRGNLTNDEAALLDRILFELRTRFIARSEEQPKS